MRVLNVQRGNKTIATHLHAQGIHCIFSYQLQQWVLCRTCVGRTGDQCHQQTVAFFVPGPGFAFAFAPCASHPVRGPEQVGTQALLHMGWYIHALCQSIWVPPILGVLLDIRREPSVCVTAFLPHHMQSCALCAVLHPTDTPSILNINCSAPHRYPSTLNINGT